MDAKPPAETGAPRQALHAYSDPEFLASREARVLRLMAEYLAPRARFEQQKVDDTIVFMGSARIVAREEAERAIEAAERGQGDLEAARQRLEMSAYYEAARTLARRLTEWSMGLDEPDRRFVVCTGGGPGIMEAANRGAFEAGGLNVGLSISIPVEEFENAYLTPELAFNFHYFFMRKFWFAYLAKAVIVFPGGFGTLDELFELLTLVQTGKMHKRLPLVLFGTQYWREVIDFDALVRYGAISPGDVDLVFRTDSIDDAYAFVVRGLEAYALGEPGPVL